MLGAQQPSKGAIAAEIARRRTFAIISHPDAGKSTLTEKLLLYGGAVSEAGAVRSRRGQRNVRSDWMALEQQRGISITSTVLRFEHRDHVLNLLDTPGHRDFSEDTYRVISAVDAAVMLLDAAKGLEEQTLRLFEIARRRGIPILTFVNKLDRPGRAPLELLDEIESRLALRCIPVNWPVGQNGVVDGIVDRRERTFIRFGRTTHGATVAPERALPLSELATSLNGDWRAAAEELELLDAVAPLPTSGVAHGRDETPVFFGSALQNLGVRLLLDALLTFAPPPSPRLDRDGNARPLEAPFSGFVFKVQANMDPRHRDRIAFVRICSGRFEPGARVVNARTGRPITLSYAHQLFGVDRQSLDEAFPGDIVAIVNAADVLIGDTLFQGERVEFPPLPTFAPERFVLARNRDSSRYKQFRNGLAQLDQEGVVQVLRHPHYGEQNPVLAGVGEMQFDVAAYRLEHEFGAPVELSPAPYALARRTDTQGARTLGGIRGAEVAVRSDGTLLALFDSEFRLRHVERDHPELTLDPILAV
jgi:peptide chain release factor 3